MGRCHRLPDQLWHMCFCNGCECRIGDAAANILHFQRDFAPLPVVMVHQMAQRLLDPRDLEHDLCLVQRFAIFGPALCISVLRIRRPAIFRDQKSAYLFSSMKSLCLHLISILGLNGSGERNRHHADFAFLCHHGNDVHPGSVDRLGSRLF